LTEHLSDLYLEMGGQRLPLPWYEADLYLCGPESFCAEFKQALVARGANADRVYSESFTAAPTVRSELDAADVRFERSGVTVTWTADEDLSLLELAERAGIEVDNDCRAGACLSCRTRVTSGSTTADLGDGAALLCLGRPTTPKLVLER
jgi:ferredoxin